MRLLVDEMWPARLAEQLRGRDHDVVAVAERADLVHQPDPTVFLAAQEERRAIFTENVPDFRPLADACLREGTRFHGLVFTTNMSFPRGHARTLGRAVRALDALLSTHPRVDGLLSRVTWL